MSHLMKTWNTAAEMSAYSRPMVALFTSQKLRARIWTIRNTAKGMKKAIRAAAQMGMISTGTLVCVSFRDCTMLTISQRIRKLWVHNLAVLEDDRKAATRRGIRHVDSETNGTHNRHGDNVQPRRLEPLAKGRSGVVRGRTMSRHPRLLAPKHARLLLVVSTSSRSCVGRNRCRAAVEETHCCGVR
jgi:hypothetical protein